MATIHFVEEIHPVKTNNSHPTRRNSSGGAHDAGVYSIRNVSRTSGLAHKDDVENGNLEESELRREGDIKKRQVSVSVHNLSARSSN